MIVKVDSVTDVKTGQYGVSSKIISGRDHYFVNDDATQYVGKDLEMEISEKTSAKGNKYKIGKILGVIPSAAPVSSNGGSGVITWESYAAMARLAHELASGLEPDGVSVSSYIPNSMSGLAGGESLPGALVDRSTARAAILNTVMIAFSNGKIAPLGPEDVSPF